jgi:hypothetical protein
MKTFLLFFGLTIFLFLPTINAQVGIGTNNPNTKSELEIISNSKGVLIPRMTLIERNAINPAASEVSLLIYQTDNTPGFYYYNGTSWIKLSTSASSDDDKDWFEEGTTSSPNAITDDMFTQGNVAIGKTTADYTLDLLTTSNNRVLNIWNNTSDNNINYGIYNRNSNNGTETNYGIFSEIDGTGNGNHYGVSNTLNGSGTGSHYGVSNSLNGNGSGFQIGVSNVLANNGDGSHYGTYTLISGSGSGNHTGSYAFLSGTGTGTQFGHRSDISNSTDSTHYGIYTALFGDGNGIHYGTFNSITGSGTGLQYGTRNQILNTSNGNHFGSYNLLGSTGNGAKIGVQNEIINSGTGWHIGIRNNLSSSPISGNTDGIFNNITRGGSGIINGVRNDLTNATSTGLKTGVNNFISGSGSTKTGIINSIQGSATATQTGVNNFVSTASNVIQYGVNNSLEAPTGNDSNTFGTFNTINGEGNGGHYGVHNTLSGTGSGEQVGIHNEISNTGAGVHTGVYNNLTGLSTGTHYGVYNQISVSGVGGSHMGSLSKLSGSGGAAIFGNRVEISNTNDANHYGTQNLLSGDGIGTHYGVKNVISGSGLNTIGASHYGVVNTLSGSSPKAQYGTLNNITNTGAGSHYGTQNLLNGIGTGLQYGTYNEIVNTGNNNHYGNYNVLSGIGNGPQTSNYNNISNTGDNIHTGVQNILTGVSKGIQYGTLTSIDVSGTGNHYGNHISLNGSGIGDKYGSYNYIDNTAGGQHYGVYSDVLKANSYAGYFLGNVSIGTTNLNNYILPSSRGINGQVMQTDGSGNLSWINPSSIGDNLGNHTATTDVNINSNDITNVKIISTLGTSNYDKIRVYSSSNYTIGMHSAMTYGFLNNWATTFTMNNDSDRGWIFRDTSDTQNDGAMSLTTDGRMTIKNFLDLPNTTDASGITGSGVLEIGNTLRLDGNEIITNTDSTLFLQHNNNGDFRVDNTSLMVDASLNRVGIGTTIPSYQLHVSTNSAAKPTSALWTVASDKRLKKNVKPFTDGLNLINKIKPVWFTYNGKAGLPNDTGVGTLAQEFQKIAPYMVKPWQYVDEEKGISESYLAVDYGPLNFVMVNAIQEQQKEIKTLEQENKILKEQVQNQQKK